MVRYAFFASALGTLFVAAPSLAADYYVAPGGSGTTCTMAAPCGRVEDGQTRAAAGDTVWIRGGTYTFAASATVGVNFNKSGAANNPIHYFAYMNETPIFDLSNGMPNARVTGFNVQCSWVHIRGLTMTGVKQFQSGQDSWGVRVQGSNNVIERVVSHHNDAPGFFITSGANNLILNCDSHHNYDRLENGGSGDGFGCHSSGGGNVIRGCRAFNNSDDGYDFINANGTCTAEQSWSWSNGYVPDTTTTAGNGAGFKSGGYGSPPANVPNPVPHHTIRQCIAFRNRSQGFYANHHPGEIDFYNNVAFSNGANYDMTADNGFPSSHVIRNNIAYSGGGTIRNLTGGTDTFNSWTLTVTVNAMDFLSVTESEAGAARQADGSLPAVSFMHLATGSDLIDKGTNVGLPFSGSAPDLGPYETGLTAGTGGMGGTGGSGTAGQATGGAGATGAGAGGAPGGAAGTGTGGALGGAAGAPAGGGASGDAGAPATGGVAGAATTGGTGTTTGGTGSGGLSTGGVGVGGATSGTGTGATAPSGGASAAGAGTGDTGSGADSTEPAGCGCRVGQGSATAPLTALFGLLGLSALVRRRRGTRR